VEGPQPKTPPDGTVTALATAPSPAPEGARAAPVAAESAESPTADVETPQAASMSRSTPAIASSSPDKSSPGARRGGLFRLSFGSFGRFGGSPGARMALAIAGGAAAIFGAVFAGVSMRSTGVPADQHVAAASLAASVAAAEVVVDGGPPEAGPEGDGDAAAAPAHVPVWRVAQLEQDPGTSVVHEVVAHRSLLVVLASAHVTPKESQRVTASLAEVRSVDRLDPKDELTVALDKGSGRIVAYELASSPSDVWQAREEAQPDGTLRLDARRLNLESSRVRVGKAVLVGADLRASFTEAGLTPVDDVLSMLDDALDGHAELSDIRPGARLRVVGTQEQVDGAFVRWVSLDAVEYFPATVNAPPVRVYAFADGEEDSTEAKRHHGWYDAKGRQPFHGGFRSPIPLARITSRYNPHRMHPVLHVVMPHNGVDFASPVGAPVYATAAGSVTSVSRDGPCGNHVEISHAGGITSVYCHLSRFAPGLHIGQHVEQRQLIAFVGQTGRVTGPHLHFGIRKNGVFVDPMTLRLDGVRVVSRGRRDDFDRQRAELDTELDGVPLPASSGASVDVSEPDTFYEEP
jgi:murein DD-endopeptidase MepM/ murein hydrolase activator NlpD